MVYCATMVSSQKGSGLCLTSAAFLYSISASATKVNPASSQILRDFQTLKTFLTSTGINTLFDAPWTIVYIVVVFLIHPYILAILFNMLSLLLMKILLVEITMKSPCEQNLHL